MSAATPPERDVPAADVRAITRPDPKLMTLYVVQAMASLCLFPVVILPLWFRYHTLRYRIDDEGVSASWGILFRREVYVTFRRIQDIHVSRNLVERWLGIGKVQIQTASGSASAELTLEGMRRYDAVRDHLYARMRGARDERGAGAAADGAHAAGAGAHAGAAAAAADAGEVVALLREIRDEVQSARRALEARREA